MQKSVLLNFEQMTREQASQPAHIMLVRIEMSRTAATTQKGAAASLRPTENQGAANRHSMGVKTEILHKP